jgi:hypothetical protein
MQTRDAASRNDRDRDGALVGQAEVFGPGGGISGLARACTVGIRCANRPPAAIGSAWAICDSCIRRASQPDRGHSESLYRQR